MVEINHKYASKGRVSTLALQIARDAVFGEDIMKRCTVMGNREYPGLPRNELFKVKEAIHNLFPELWKVPEEFEAIWSDCVDAIGQGCKRLRKI